MKPRCQGAKTPGQFTSFICVLDDGHNGFCEPYVAPTVDEWRAVIAERDALAADAKDGERLRIRLANMVASEQKQHEWTKDQLKTAYADVDRLQDEARAIKNGVCPSCSDAWWAREHDRAAAAEKMAEAAADLTKARQDRDVAQSQAHAAARDMVAMAADRARLQAELDALRAIVESGKGSP